MVSIVLYLPKPTTFIDCHQMTNSKSYVRELPFWIALTFWSFVPTSTFATIRSFPIPLRVSDLLLFALSALYCALAGARHLFVYHNTHLKLSSRLRTVIGLLILYAFVSMRWSHLADRDYLPVSYTLVGAAAALILSLSVLANRSASDVHSFLIRLTKYLSAVCLLYFLESYLGLGLRSAEGRVIDDFGIDRFKGPLFGSSVGHILIVPCLAVSLDRLTRTESRKAQSLWLLISIIFSVSCLGLGSRSAVICLCCFALTLTLTVKGLERKLLYASSLVALGAMSAIVVFSRASIDRLGSLEDTTRTYTYETAFRIFSSSWQTCLVGSGYGSIWPWYLTDMLDGGPQAYSEYISSTPFGETLYHPHSTLALLGAELGLLGIMFALAGCALICMVCVNTIKRRSCIILASGVASSGLALLWDLYFFKFWVLSCLWLIYVFGIVKLIELRNEQASAEPPKR